MSELYRFGISLEKELIKEFDTHIREKNYPNRSEAIRDLIRRELTLKTRATGGIVAGAVVMTYDHHKRELVTKLIEIQHEYQRCIISTQHVHLDHHTCLEIIAVKGDARTIEMLSAAITAHIGVRQVGLCLSAAGEQCCIAGTDK